MIECRHFSECRHVPEKVKCELKNTSGNRKNTSSINNSSRKYTNTGSTKQFVEHSAKDKGLVETKKGLVWKEANHVLTPFVPSKRKKIQSKSSSPKKVKKKKKEKQDSGKMLNFDVLVKQKFINLSDGGLFDGDLDHVLYQVIEQSTVLEDLWLEGNNLTLADGKLANAIAKNTTLKKLYIYNNNIGPEGIKLLADALKKNNMNILEGLYLYDNIIGDEGAKYIAKMLADNKTLQKIGLNDNNISDKGAQSLATSLLQNTTLHTIDLGTNSIGDKGAQSIATSLVINTGIQEIYLDDNKIGDRGAEKIADALEANHNIETLDLSGNNTISNRVRDRINAILNDPKRAKMQR